MLNKITIFLRRRPNRWNRTFDKSKVDGRTSPRQNLSSLRPQVLHKKCDWKLNQNDRHLVPDFEDALNAGWQVLEWTWGFEQRPGAIVADYRKPALGGWARHKALWGGRNKVHARIWARWVGKMGDWAKVQKQNCRYRETKGWNKSFRIGTVWLLGIPLLNWPWAYLRGKEEVWDGARNRKVHSKGQTAIAKIRTALKRGQYEQIRDPYSKQGGSFRWTA